VPGRRSKPPVDGADALKRIDLPASGRTSGVVCCISPVALMRARAAPGAGRSALAELREAVASYTARGAEKLRRQHLATAGLMVFIETNPFKPNAAQHYAARPVRLPVATSDTAKLIGAALAGLAAIWGDGYRYKKAGVVLLDLHPSTAVQEGLFDKRDDARRVALMRTVDRLNIRFGREHRLFRRRRPAASSMETAPGIAVAVLHDGVGRAAAGLAGTKFDAESLDSLTSFANAGQSRPASLMMILTGLSNRRSRN
jgi:hypothetical protein